MFTTSTLKISNNTPHLLVFDTKPYMSKYFLEIKEVLTRYIKGNAAFDQHVDLLVYDIFKDIMMDIFSCFDESDHVWLQALNRSDLYPDITMLMDTFPTAGIVLSTDLNENILNTISINLRVVSVSIFNDLVWWFNQLSPIKRPLIQAITVLSVTPHALFCHLYYTGN